MSEPIKPAEDKLVVHLRELACDLSSYVKPPTWPTSKAQLVQGLEQAAARIESDAAKIKALELERDTIQEYADRIGANLTAAEETLKERDEQIARMAQALVKARQFICDYDAMNQSHLGWPSDVLAAISKVLKEADRG